MSNIHVHPCQQLLCACKMHACGSQQLQTALQQGLLSVLLLCLNPSPCLHIDVLETHAACCAVLRYAVLCCDVMCCNVLLPPSTPCMLMHVWFCCPWHVQTSCSVSTKAPATFASVSAVAASQCAALANAGCQKMATSATYSPCGANQYFGHRVCSGRQFADIYRVKVGELCLGAMHKLG